MTISVLFKLQTIIHVWSPPASPPNPPPLPPPPPPPPLPH